MGPIIGALVALVLFSLFGLLPAFRLGSSLALYILYKATGRSVEPTPAARAFIIAAASLCILCGGAIAFFAGALLGSFFLR